MNNKMICTLAVGLAANLLLLAMPLSAQEEESQIPQFEERIFTVQYGNLDAIYEMVRVFRSPFGKMNADRGSSIIVVRDTPETIDRVAKIIAEMDVPPDSIRLTFFVFVATRDATGGLPSDIPEGVTKSLTELTKLMSYRSYRLEGQVLLTVASTANVAETNISSDIGRITIRFTPRYNSQGKILSLEELRLFIVRSNGESSQPFRTDVVVEDGGVSIVGASKINGGDEALLAIVSMDVETLGQ